MNRRNFNASILAAAAAYKFITVDDFGKKKILPPRLNPGDLIGIISPAGVLTEEKIQTSIDKAISYGFRVKEGKYLRKKFGYLAGKDEQRLEDFHSMYSDPEVKGIWCARGGYGCTRILDKIDFRLIKKNPKVLIGYSDITALLNAIYQRTGIVGFHGPLGASEDNTFSRTILRDLTMNVEKRVTIEPFYPVDTSYDDVKSIIPGQATGIAVGGNLSLIAAMVGTPYEIKFKDKIVFIEDVGEEPYRIDRMLTQVVESSDIARARGIVLGQFSGCNPDNPERSLSLMQVLEDRLKSLNIPCVYGLNFGHVAHNFTIPIGANVNVDFRTGKILVPDQTVR
ncbi:S66 peptidase family protein [Portibacter lacus]|uniref:Murein peptide carboxypeptidase n=1 Tax=Portibacter lacus TaxID=1099794 RepID=A0AA37SJ74_9BACT|nr:LD-carboxypeptidase [Portibacter lacus]GLR15421.1 putative murein peptide carboxypeptidase [Portibacter lacus]